MATDPRAVVEAGPAGQRGAEAWGLQGPLTHLSPEEAAPSGLPNARLTPCCLPDLPAPLYPLPCCHHRLDLVLCPQKTA